ncbi:sigma-70 family RNA polymerase sigma factor [Hymenobacter sp. J193]|uniref:RNA polymerase sigma factor n=1 Tax=Hymenobacter sp. J193 TaxID=2898429 RepID=UPI002151E43B|nr:sigma-70 family RNA polymerase sigma factor [Hymenobacter sp. J193]MCR5890924.1 sigma-70 family RNA polymerase sigma factor [Hymenobacter sp. J193]
MPELNAFVWDEFRAGSQRSFEHIFLAYYDSLYGYGMQLAHDQEVVKDCLQSLFHRLWQRRTRLGAVEEIRPYLFKALRNEVTAALTARRRQGELPKASPQEVAVPFTVEDFLNARPLTAEQHAQLLAALTQLSNHQREAVHLRFFEGIAFECITTIMELQPQSVRNLIQQSIRRLRLAWPLLAKLLLRMEAVVMTTKQGKLMNLLISGL